MHLIVVVVFDVSLVVDSCGKFNYIQTDREIISNKKRLAWKKDTQFDDPNS
jgi:hypothetical protein